MRDVRAVKQRFTCALLYAKLTIEMTMETFAFFIYSFTSVFVLVNPIGGLVTFVGLTEGMTDEDRRDVAKKAVLVGCIMTLVFALTGEMVLRFFHITVDNLRVAGGILLFVIALDMMHAKVSRESVTPEELREARRKDDITVFPVATPLLAGPGTLTTAIVLIRIHKSLQMKLVALASIVVTFAITFLFLRYSVRLYRVFGVVASMVITRIMGLFLAALAVNFVATGIWNIYQSFQ